MDIGVMDFKNPTFHTGFNTTVRRGDKWSDLKPGMKLLITLDAAGTTDEVLICRVLLTRFGYLHEADVRDEHDPKCRSLTGLHEELCRCYPGFSMQDQIIAITFYFHGVNP
jgi:hypothetical protein